MRREGYELSVGKPEVIIKRGRTASTHEPIEYLVVDVPHDQIGPVMELVGNRRGELPEDGRRREPDATSSSPIPARGLIGLRTRLLNATQGEAIMHHNFHDYQPLRGDDPAPAQRRDGLAWRPARRPPTRSTTCRSAARCSSRPATQVYEGRSSASTAATTTCRSTPARRRS